MKKQFQLWLFVLGMGYIFVELQRFTSGATISLKEWIGFIIIIGMVAWLWIIGDKMDKEEKNKQKEETKQLIKDTIKELKDKDILK